MLYPDALRDLHIRMALAGLIQARWSRQIVDEALSALADNRPDIPPVKLDRLRYLINESVPDCLVTGYEPLIESLKLPDPDDRHVLAAGRTAVPATRPGPGRPAARHSRALSPGASACGAAARPWK